MCVFGQCSARVTIAGRTPKTSAPAARTKKSEVKYEKTCFFILELSTLKNPSNQHHREQVGQKNWRSRKGDGISSFFFLIRFLFGFIFSCSFYALRRLILFITGF
jgi:hypothetical protein